jgi:hypothetical protein
MATTTKRTDHALLGFDQSSISSSFNERCRDEPCGKAWVMLWTSKREKTGIGAEPGPPRKSGANVS